MFNKEFLTQPFALGFYTGCFLLLICLYNFIKVKAELSRFRRLLSDKLELEADTMKKLKAEVDTLKKENESLRMKVNALNEIPDRKVQRDVEIYARAEKRMLLSVPGFAPAWETAKTEAHGELTEEETGKSTPKRIFKRLFGGGNQALPARDESKVGSDN